MESKKKLIELLSGLEREQNSYFLKMFANIPDEAIKYMHYKKVKKNEMIIRAGDAADTVYMILAGKVTGVDYQWEGNVYVFMDFYRMDVVGDFEVFADMARYSASIRAAEDSEMLCLPADCYLKWMKQDSNALFLRTKKLMKTLLSEKIDERKNLFLNCKDRLMLYLVHSYEENGNGKESYKISKTQAEVADSIGFSVRNVQRSILSLKENGDIDVKKGKIYISNKQYLRLKKNITSGNKV